MRVAIVKNSNKMGERAFLEIKNLLAAKPDATLGLVPGQAVNFLYYKMAEDFSTGSTSYAGVKAVGLGEFVGYGPTSGAGCAHMLREQLFDYIDIAPENIRSLDGAAENLAGECSALSAYLRENPIDLMVLEIGANGQLVFNEPHTREEDPAHISELTARTRYDSAYAFKSASAVPSHALTVGLSEIKRAKKIILLASGEVKAQAVYDLFTARDDMSCPAVVLRAHADTTLVVDKEAAALLDLEAWENATATTAAPAPVQVAEQEVVPSAPVDMLADDVAAPIKTAAPASHDGVFVATAEVVPDNVECDYEAEAVEDGEVEFEAEAYEEAEDEANVLVAEAEVEEFAEGEIEDDAAEESDVVAEKPDDELTADDLEEIPDDEELVTDEDLDEELEDVAETSAEDEVEEVEASAPADEDFEEVVPAEDDFASESEEVESTAAVDEEVELVESVAVEETAAPAEDTTDTKHKKKDKKHKKK